MYLLVFNCRWTSSGSIETRSRSSGLSVYSHSWRCYRYGRYVVVQLSSIHLSTNLFPSDRECEIMLVTTIRIVLIVIIVTIIIIIILTAPLSSLLSHSSSCCDHRGC